MNLWRRFDDEQWTLMANSRLSRRQLLRRSVATGLAVPAVAGLLAACGETGEDTAIADEPPTAAPDTDDETDDTDADEPEDDDAEVEESEDVDDEGEEEPDPDARRGGSLRIGLSGSAQNFDPHHQTTFESIWPNGMMYSRLVRLSREMEIVPDLARSWEQNEDATEWTFQLHENVMFHNGRQMEGQDVVNSFDRLMDPEEGTAFAQQLACLDLVGSIHNVPA
jgi:peptide/nickel transport system substrate-binding protein